jgi:hypothetical protein
MSHHVTKEGLFQHGDHAPSYYVQDISSNGDEAALLLLTEMQNRAWDILCSDKVIEYYSDTDYSITGFADLSRGHCEDVACYAYNKLCNSGLDDSRATMHVLTIPEADDVVFQHGWVELEGLDGLSYNFDVDTWWGVKDHRHLKTLQENPYLTHYAGNIRECNPLHLDASQVFGVHGYKNDVLSKRN